MIFRGGSGIGNIDELVFGPFQQTGMGNAVPSIEIPDDGERLLYRPDGVRIYCSRAARGIYLGVQGSNMEKTVILE